MRNGLMLLLCLVLLGACNNAMVKSEFKATDHGAWNKNDTISFSFSEMDTLEQYNIYLNLRNDQNYPYSNLFLITTLKDPSGTITTDTLEYEMALPDGTWLGKGFGSIKENKLWYRENVVFSSSGVYTLNVIHAMRKNGNVDGVLQLEGITDVGFEIVKSNK